MPQVFIWFFSAFVRLAAVVLVFFGHDFSADMEVASVVLAHHSGFPSAQDLSITKAGGVQPPASYLLLLNAA